MLNFKYKNEIYLLPFLVFVFLFNLHYYNFYQQDFKTVQGIISPNFKINQYEQIQEYHPYYMVYKLANEYKNNTENRVFNIFLKISDQKLDYTSTVYAKKKDPKTTTKIYLNELQMMINYYFYPKIVTPIQNLSIREFGLLNTKKGDLFFSDSELGKDYIIKYKLKRIFFVSKDLIRINRWKEDIYYIYKVE